MGQRVEMSVGLVEALESFIEGETVAASEVGSDHCPGALDAANNLPRLSKGDFPKGNLLTWLAALGRAPTYVQSATRKRPAWWTERAHST